MVCVTSSYPLANKKNDVVLKYKTERRDDSSTDKTNTSVKQHVMGLAQFPSCRLVIGPPLGQEGVWSCLPELQWSCSAAR